MINDILQKDTIKADLGFGVDYYKGKDGKDGKTPIKGVDYFTQTEIQQIEDNAAAKVDLSDYAKTADLSTVATSGSYNDLVDKPTIPAAYELPTASATTLGGVKVDGNTITIADGVISTKGGSGGVEPDAYIKDASVSGNTLTLTKKDDTEVVFAPSGGSGGGGKEYTFTNGLTETDGTVSLDFYKEGYKGNNAKIETNGIGSIAFGYLEYNGAIGTAAKGSMAFGFTEYGGSIIASGAGSFAHGYADSITMSAQGLGSHVEGYCTTQMSAQGIGSHAEGHNTISASNYQHAEGKYNIADSANTYQGIVGNGTSDTSRSNAYTLDWQGNGTFAGTVSSSTGADYAEYFEWKDGNPNNEDRVGYIVTLDGDKIVKANTGDDVLGICSGTAMVLGDSAEWNWNKRYLTDDFGRIIYEDRMEHHEAIYNPDGELIKEAWDEEVHAPKLNPDYDASRPYVKRADRPEWQIVGMMGKLYVRDDGSCIVNGYADVKDGIATKASGKTNMRVMERITDNIVRVLMK